MHGSLQPSIHELTAMLSSTALIFPIYVTFVMEQRIYLFYFFYAKKYIVNDVM